jgi:hypothetical protein
MAAFHLTPLTIKDFIVECKYAACTSSIIYQAACAA